MDESNKKQKAILLHMKIVKLLLKKLEEMRDAYNMLYITSGILEFVQVSSQHL